MSKKLAKADRIEKLREYIRIGECPSTQMTMPMLLIILKAILDLMEDES